MPPKLFGKLVLLGTSVSSVIGNILSGRSEYDISGSYSP